VILAMGGGGFTMRERSSALDRFVLSLCDRPVPRICFLPTASGDPRDQVTRFFERFASWPCEPSVLSLFHLGESRLDPVSHLLAQDLIYVGGGSMRNMLAIWREHGIDEAMRIAWHRGVVLAGLSAGAMCWFEAGVTRSSGPPETLAGLGLLEGSLTVHADGEPERLPVWLAHVRDGSIPGGWAVDDGVGLLFRGLRLERIVSSRPGAGAQRVDAIAGELVRHRLQPTLLGESLQSVEDEAVQELRRVHRMRRRIVGGWE
jgi:peptidase E